MKYTQSQLDEIALSTEEYQLIVSKLGRDPNNLELGLFGALWSEHCGYKHSKNLIKTLPNSSSALLAKPGEENAGVIDIGNDLAIVFKIESHNHPSAVEPYQGAATGVGGIIRDILAMGARPIAILNSLRFGYINTERGKYLFEGIVSGISGYGNCIGIPNIGGETKFSDSYSGNPLVNAFCLGIVNKNNLMSAASYTPGNLIMVIGSPTGRDGIHGASGLASRNLNDDKSEQDKRPTVQIGNPFMEKVLIESCLEIVSNNLIESLQDLGAAGLTSAIVETVDKGKVGFTIDLAKVHQRESNMTPYEIMLSESQERMLIVFPPENMNKIKSILDKWDLDYSTIGTITNSQNAEIYYQEDLVGTVPINTLTTPPLYDLDNTAPKAIVELQNSDLSLLPLPDYNEANEILVKLLSSPNIASKNPVFIQYDHQVQTNTIASPEDADSAIIRIKDTNLGIGISIDGNGKTTYLNPLEGGKIAVAEACRNLICSGVEPIAITNCLNFGDPTTQLVSYQLNQSVKGIAEGCNTFGIPVISGNVSLYNSTEKGPIFPTPIIGAVGIIKNVTNIITSEFKNYDDLVILLGSESLSYDHNDLAGSEYLEIIHNKIAGSPQIDLEFENRLQQCCLNLINNRLLNSAHDCSEGGIAVTIAESCILSNIGFESKIKINGRWDIPLFGEKHSQIIVSINPNDVNTFSNICDEYNIPFVSLGITKPDIFKINSLISNTIVELKNAYSTNFVK
ncbi:MAG: phosphoribosylformylglycinamidine synthase subunit PurL [Dehalococcoidia bacterium]